jgi:uncharacterized protein (TIGR03000 family)
MSARLWAEGKLLVLSVACLAFAAGATPVHGRGVAGGARVGARAGVRVGFHHGFNGAFGRGFGDFRRFRRFGRGFDDFRGLARFEQRFFRFFPEFPFFGRFGRFNRFNQFVNTGFGWGFGGFGYPGDYGFWPGWYGSGYPYGYGAGYGGGGGAGAADGGGPVAVTVRVPADAEVWFDGKKDSQKGLVRRFRAQSPEAGGPRSHDIRARWKARGKTEERTRKVEVAGGDQVSVLFLGGGNGR